MSSLHLPLSSIYLDDPKGQRALRTRQSFLLVCSLIGTALVFTFLVAFASVHHSVGTEILAPQETSLLVRAEYPVSTYVYERGLFSWFIGIATTAAVGYAVSFTNVGTACVVAGPITVASCVGAAIAAVLVVATVAHVNSRQKKGNIELSLMRSAMIYMEPVDKSAKRGIHPVEQFFSELYGVDDYRFEGRITADDHFNKPLVDRNKGADVPVFSFTSPHGIRFHHAIVYNEEDGTAFHRFGLPGPAPSSATQTKRTTIYGEQADPEYFKSGGLDALAANIDNGNDQNLHADDYSKMVTELECVNSGYTSAGELGAQIYDATTQETIGFSTVAPVQADGDTVLFSGAQFKPPLTEGDTCAQQTSSD